MTKIKVATLQGKWTGDFDSNNAWYVALALEGAGLFHVPGVVAVEIACPLALQRRNLYLAHVISRCHSGARSAIESMDPISRQRLLPG